jgi:Leucine rich repeat
MSFILTTTALYLDCTYSMRSHWTVPNIYTCTARPIFVGDPHNVTDVSQNHLAGRNNSDVKGLSIRNHNIKVLPRNVDQFFTNIEAIDITNTLEEISREDLAVFPNLKELHLNDNKVQVINSNLFQGNPLMSAISFISNPIRNVAAGVFDDLADLVQLRFDGVACHSQAATNRATVNALIPRISVQCPPTFDMNFEMIEKRLLNGVGIKKVVDEQVSERINPLTWSVFQVNHRLYEIEEKMKQLEKEIQNLSLVKEFLKNNQQKL